MVILRSSPGVHHPGMPRTLVPFTCASLLTLAAACGDDSPSGEGGGGSGTTSSSGSTSSTSTTTTTTSTTTSSSSSSTTGGEGGAGGDGGGEASGGAGGEGGAPPVCDRQPKAFALADFEAPCDELATELEEGAFHVEWLDVPRDEVFEFNSEVGVDFAWPYVITFPEEDAAEMELIHTRCFAIAGQDEFCTEGPVEPMPTEGVCTELLSPRFGLDPTQYAEGENHYTVGFVLRRGCAEVKTEFTFTVLYLPE